MTFHEQVEAKVKLRGGPNHVTVEKVWDDLWIAEKFQSNSDIAGSPRNSFRASVGTLSNGGRALNGLGGIALTEPYQTPNAIYFYSGSQTVNDKIHGRKGNSPDRQLRSQSVS